MFCVLVVLWVGQSRAIEVQSDWHDDSKPYIIAKKMVLILLIPSAHASAHSKCTPHNAYDYYNYLYLAHFAPHDYLKNLVSVQELGNISILYSTS